MPVANKLHKKTTKINLMVLGLLLLLLISLIRTAWISDDAYHTFLAIDNWFNGYGLTGNITHRVQSYTHPLWLMAITGVFLFTHEFYYTTLVLSLILSVSAVLLLVKYVAVSMHSAILGLVILLISRTFIEYSTSGLEGPLVYLLLTIWWMVVIRSKKQDYRGLFRVTFVTGLIGLTRLDLLLLVGPLLIYTWWRNRGLIVGHAKEFIRTISIGLFPLWGWSLWALIYYGFPTPNTAYAKLISLDINKILLWRQGVYYLIDVLNNDPITLLIVSVVIVYFLYMRRIWFKMVALGLSLYVGYVVYIGGDFMSGRFLAAPLFMSVLLLVRMNYSNKFITIIGVLVFFVSLLSPWPLSIMSDSNFDIGKHNYRNNHGIANERAYYYQRTGLLSNARIAPRYGQAFRESTNKHGDYIVIPNITGGIVALQDGPNVLYVDDMAINDALLARIPSSFVDWRIGHFRRLIPAGYTESLMENKNLINNKNLKEYYEAIRIITTGPLFTRERWQAIWKLNTGQLDGLIDEYAAVMPVSG